MTALTPYVASSLFPSHCGLQYRAEAVSVEPDIIGQFQMSLPIDQAIEFCKSKLLSAEYSVLQVGHRTLLGRKNGATIASIEVKLERHSGQNTDVTYLLLP